MTNMKTAVMKAAMTGLYHSRAHRLLAPYTQGSGVIFTLHHVRPDCGKAFAPNRILEVTPEFLEAVLDQVQEQALDVVGLDEAVRRLRQDDPRRFACFTFDDGYRDNRLNAFPIFKRRRLPLTLYVPTDYPSGKGELWWIALEQVIASASEIELCRNGELWRLPAKTIAEKWRAYEQIYWWLRSIDEATQRQIIRTLAERHEIDMGALCRDLVMSWDEIREAAKDPLLTIGAHTCRHFALSRLDAEEARREMVASRARIEAEIGRPCRHFSFPYGCERAAGPREFALARELGFATAVTTRKGLVTRGHAATPTAIPRLSLNGDFQSERYVDVMLSGLPFAMWNAARRVLGPAAARRREGLVSPDRVATSNG